ncbi:MAG: hypothetical protein PWP45_1733 [Tepidanaerobacteraceae bacterium]|nr:hypothetical protein [Tepidanaerobacteraceae bacterium]
MTHPYSQEGVKADATIPLTGGYAAFPEVDFHHPVNALAGRK